MEWTMWSALGALGSAALGWITLMLTRARHKAAQVAAEEALKAQAKAAAERAQAAQDAANLAAARCELLAHELSGFKIEAAERYVTSRALDQLAERLTTDMHRLSDELRASTCELTRRFDELTRSFFRYRRSQDRGQVS